MSANAANSHTARQPKPMRVLIGGGGTAGHIYPALSIVHELMHGPSPLSSIGIGGASRSTDGSGDLGSDVGGSLTGNPDASGPQVHFAHGPSRIDLEVLAHAGIARTRIAASPVRGVTPHRAAIGMLRLIGAFGQAWRLVGTFRPNVVLVTGGYVSAPVLVAARIRGVPSVVFLPDIVPGFAVRAMAPFASRVAVSFAATRAHWKSSASVVTGYPVRPEFLAANRERGRASFGIVGDRPVLLATGGSSGARSINFALMDVLEPLLHHADLIHLCGELDEARLRATRNALPTELRRRYHLYRYLHKGMADAMAASDLVICRAGASTMAELPAVGRPAIVIPGTFAGGHQAENASVLVAAGAAVMVPDDALGASSRGSQGPLLSTILELLGDKDRLSGMATASRTLARPEAAANIVSLLASVART